LRKKLDEYYNSIASSYNELHSDEQLKKLKIVHELLDSDPEFNVSSDLILLDIGCGTGLSTDKISSNHAGLDPAIKLLEQANNTRAKSLEHNTHTVEAVPPARHLGYICGIAEALPIKEKVCNIVISITAVHNFNDISKGIQEIQRITKNRAVLTVLKQTVRFNEIVEIIKKYFLVLNKRENEFDYFLYLEPLPSKI